MNSDSQLSTLSSQLAAGPHQPVDLALPACGELIPFPTGRFAIPDEQMGDFNKLKDREKERVKFLLSLFARMEAGGIVPTSETLGFQLRAQRGFGASNLRTQYYKWRDHGWLAIARKYSNGCEKLPAEFVEHFRALCEQNGRSMKQAMNKLYRAWDAGESIPGFGTWREYYSTIWPERDLPSICPGTPTGWKKSNLYTLQPTKAARALKTRGWAAMKAQLPSMVRNPGKLRPLELIVIDDFEIDQMCFVNQWDPVEGARLRAICRMAGVCAMDVATRRIIGMILKPRLTKDDGAKQSITRAEVRLLLYGILRDYGIPAHGMTILCEKAAAAVTAELQMTFENLFGGRVAITRTSTIDQKVLLSGFRDSGGKPWLKGWIESFFNLMHNYAAGVLPGQKGASYLVKPADLEEKLRVTQRLIGTGDRDARLSDEQLARARVAFKSPAELCDAYLQIFSWIEQREDHELLGFDRVYRFREPGEMTPWQPWENLARYSDEQQALMIPDDRPETPRERWAKLWPAVQCAKPEAAALMLLLLTPKKATLKGHHLTFDHNKAGYTWIVGKDSPIRQLPQGAEVLCYFDAAKAATAHVARLDGRWLGEVTRWGGKNGSVDLTSLDQVTEAERQLAELYGSVLAEVRSRPLHQAEEAQLAEDAAVNAVLVDEAARTRELGLTATLARPVAAVDASASPVTAKGRNLAAQVVHAAHMQAAAKQTAKALAAASDQSSSLLDEPESQQDAPPSSGFDPSTLL